MEASIDERHLKDFIKILVCASRYGDELCMSANKDLWELAVTNSSKSAFCLFKLRPSFFCRYKALGSPIAQRRGVKCQLLVKSVLAVLGKSSSANSIQRLDLKVHDPGDGLRSRRRKSTAQPNGTSGSEHGTMDVDGDAEEEDELSALGSMLILKLVCKHGVTKKHSLHLAATDFLRAEVDPASTPNSFTVSAKTVRDWLAHFSIADSFSSAGAVLRPENQIGWLFAQEEVRLKSWEGINKDLSTTLRLDRAEFGVDGEGKDRYYLEDERVELTLPMKEFKATLQLAEVLNVDMKVAFSAATQPLTMTYEGEDGGDDYDIFCAIATTTCDAFTDVVIPQANGNGHHGAANGVADHRPRRTTSDISDAALPPAGQRSVSRDTGPGDAEGSRKRQKSATPARSRAGSRLDMTPGRASQSTQSAVVYNSMPTAPTNRHGQESLFMPGGSQGDADHDNADGQDGPGAPSQSRRELTQAELVDISGLGPMDELMSQLEQEEEAEYRESQQVIEQDRRAQARHRDSEEDGRNDDGNTTAANGHVSDTEFQADDTIFGVEQNGEDGPDADELEDAPQMEATQRTEASQKRGYRSFFDD